MIDSRRVPAAAVWMPRAMPAKNGSAASLSTTPTMPLVECNRARACALTT